jgi:hypothetical protein
MSITNEMLWKLNLLQIEFQFWLQSFWQTVKNKRDLRKRSLNEQERHLALGMPSLETAHTGRVREDTYAKQH